VLQVIRDFYKLGEGRLLVFDWSLDRLGRNSAVKDLKSTGGLGTDWNQKFMEIGLATLSRLVKLLTVE
jgi:hypothetical protein